NTNEVSDNDVQNVLKLMAFNNSTNYKIVRSINKKNNIIEDGKLLNDSKISKYKDAEGRFNLFIRERNIDEDKLYMLSGLDLSGDKALPRYRRINTPSLITESR